MNCPFCSSEINSSSFLSSENFTAIYNIAPVIPGHSLIISKNHKISYFDLLDDEKKELSLFIEKVSKLLMKAFDADSFNFSLQDGESAGQTIPHFHLHILPRRKDDLESPGDWYPLIDHSENHLLDSFTRKKLSEKDLNTILDHLRSI